MAHGPGIEQAIRDGVGYVIPVVEAVGAAVVVVGVLVALAMWLGAELRVRPAGYEGVRLVLGRFLALGLEFQLGADILGTAVSPSWDEIGRLGAIAGIRTVLNYFLAQDLEHARSTGASTSPEHRAAGAAPAGP